MLFCVWGYAQEIPSIIPPTPEAISLAKFSEIPVSKYTGTANISVPIFTIQERGITVPIELNYHTRGIKIGEVASRVGLGWALSHGGAISRQIRGEADEAPYGYFDNMDDFKDFLINKLKREKMVSSMSVGHPYDYTPDKFMISTSSGVNGSFIYDYNDGQPLLQKFADVKIETIYKTPDINTQFNLLGFKVTDSNGTIFYFGISKDKKRIAISYDRVVKSENYLNGSLTIEEEGIDFYPSAWQLMEIHTPEGGKVEYIYPNEPEESTFYRKGPDKVVTNGVRSSFSKMKSIQYHVKEIRFSSGSLHFIPNTTEREDLVGGFNLKNILLTNNVGKVIKRFDLSHAYTLGTTNNQLELLDQLDPKSKKRMFLTKLTEVNLEGGKSIPLYEFEYNSGVLPSRFSTSQDGWGYYNGANNGRFLTFFNENNTADDRKVNSSFLSAGMLKKIKYPTGGSQVLVFEDNIVKTSYVSKSIVTSPLKETVTVSKQITKKDFVFDEVGGYRILKVEIPAPNTQFEFHCKHLVIDTGMNVDCDKDPGLCESIEDNKIPDCIFGLGISSDGISITGRVFPGDKFTRNAGYIYFKPFPLPGNTDENDEPLFLKDQYDFAIEMRYEEVKEDGGGDSETYGGGKRIKRIEMYDKENSLASFKEYSYKNENGISTGELLGLPGYVQKSNDNREGLPFLMLFQHGNMPGSPLSTDQGNSVGYSLVTEYLGSKTNNTGKVEYEYLVTGDTGSGYNYPYNIPNNHEWLRGANLETRFFEKNGRLIKKIEKEFLYANNQEGYDSYATFYSAQTYLPLKDNLNIDTYQYVKNSTLFRLPMFEVLLARDLRKLIITEDFLIPSVQDELNKKWDNGDYVVPDEAYYYKAFQLTGGTSDLYKTIETSYFDSGSTETITNYFYNYDKHYQLSKKKQTKSNGDIIINETIYPQDIVSRTTPEQELVTTHRYIPIETLTYQDYNKNGITESDELLFHQKTVYGDFDGVNLPNKIQAFKGAQTLKDRVIYHSYGSKGNPTEVSRKDGVHIVYIWGYNKTRPIAKIENATLSDIPSAIISEIESASNQDIDVTTEDSLRVSLDKLRNHNFCPLLSDAQVTTFTYNPLVGVTSTTDPRGQTIYYEYDDFNRLEFIKDADGNLLKEHKYNYKN
ncbi:conserved hypothetical protein [Tenacibaculum litoreum]